MKNNKPINRTVFVRAKIVLRAYGLVQTSGGFRQRKTNRMSSIYDSPKSKNEEANNLAFALGIGALIITAVSWNYWDKIVYTYVTNCDKLFFVGWLVILFLIYKTVRKDFDRTKENRQSLLRMKRLRDQDTKRVTTFNVNRSRISSGRMDPVTSYQPAYTVTQKITEIKVGERIKDKHPVYLSDKKRCDQVQALGSTGRGKTESVILPWIIQDFRKKKNPVILIDGKGDPVIARRFKQYCETADNKADIFVFDPMDKNSCVLNPLKWGTPLQITDRVMSSFEFDDSYYKGIQSEGVLTVVSLIQEVEKEVTFQKIDRAIRDVEYLTELSNESNNSGLKSRARTLMSAKESERLSNFSGLLSQLSPFVTGEIAELVNGVNAVASDGGKNKKQRRELSLTKVMTGDMSRPQAALILIPTLIYQEVGRAIGKMLLQEIAFCVGMRSSKGEQNPFTSVFLDEFSSFAYLGFEQILNKARSANVAMHLSHQSMGDLEKVSPDFAKILNTNTNVKCLLGLNDPDTADFFARHMGTSTSTKFTERYEERDALFGTQSERTGQKSVREAEIYKIHPNRLKNLTAGEGVIHVPGKPESVTEVIQFYDLYSLGIEPLNHEEVA